MNRYLGIALLVVSGSVYAQSAGHFLDAHELAALSPNPDVPGVMRHLSDGADLSKYTKIIIGSVSFFFADDSKYKSIDADEMKTIADAMKSAMAEAAAEKAEVVLTIAPDAVLINIAITEIKLANKKRGLMGYTPVGLVVSTAANMSGLRIQLNDARIEGEAIDSATGATLSVFRLEILGDYDGEKALSWDDLQGNLKASFGQALAALHAR